MLFDSRLRFTGLTVGFSIRYAQAQGLHIDGSKWNLSPREIEIRRKLWVHVRLVSLILSLSAETDSLVPFYQLFCLDRFVHSQSQTLFLPFV